MTKNIIIIVKSMRNYVQLGGYMKTIIFRPTNNCNLRCTYCYDQDSHNDSITNCQEQSNQVFEREYQQLLRDFEILYAGEERKKLILHGGEPLLIRPTNIDRLCHDLNQNFGDVKYSIQTNGTLITKEVIDVFKKYNFSVGLSLDGCNEAQNCQRIFPNNKNSFESVMRKIRLLQDEEVKFGIIMSIAKQHIGCEQEMYDFISRNHLRCNIRPVFASSQDAISKVMTEDEFATFYNNMFDIWFNDTDERISTYQITELYDSLKEVIVAGYVKNSCSNTQDCFRNFISLDVDSNLYACNRLYGKKEFYYGNLKTDDMAVIQEKIEQLARLREELIAKRCGDCEIYGNCYGGCPAEGYSVNKSLGERSPLCKIKKLTRSHIKGVVYE